MSVACTTGKKQASIDKVSIHFNLKTYKAGKVVKSEDVFHTEKYVDMYTRFNIPKLEGKGIESLEFTVEGGDTITLTRPSFPHDYLCFLTDHETVDELNRNPYKHFWTRGEDGDCLVGANAAGRAIQPGKVYYLAQMTNYTDNYVLALKGGDGFFDPPLITFQISVTFAEEPLIVSCDKDQSRAATSAQKQQGDGGAPGGPHGSSTPREKKRRESLDDEASDSNKKKSRTEAPAAAAPVAAASPVPESTIPADLIDMLRPVVPKALPVFSLDANKPNESATGANGAGGDLF